MFYLCSKNKGTDQLHGYRTADLRLFCMDAKNRFSHDRSHSNLKETQKPYCKVLEFFGTQSLYCKLCKIPSKSFYRGGLAQWLVCQISDQGVPGLSPGLCTVCCGLEQVTFTSCSVLVKPMKQWTDHRPGQTVTRLETMLCLLCQVQGT